MKTKKVDMIWYNNNNNNTYQYWLTKLSVQLVHSYQPWPTTFQPLTLHSFHAVADCILCDVVTWRITTECTARACNQPRQQPMCYAAYRPEHSASTQQRDAHGFGWCGRCWCDIRCVRAGCQPAVGVSERTEPTWYVKVKAALVSLGQYVQLNFSLCCRLRNDRNFGHNHAYGQKIRQIRVGLRADPQHGDEGCASGDSEQLGCKTDGRDLRAGPTGEREIEREMERAFRFCCFPHLVLMLFCVTTVVPLPVGSLIVLPSPTEPTAHVVGKVSAVSY